VIDGVKKGTGNYLEIGGRAVVRSSLASLVPEFRAGEALEVQSSCYRDVCRFSWGKAFLVDTPDSVVSVPANLKKITRRAPENNDSSPFFDEE
jgi:hypothetical protein